MSKLRWFRLSLFVERDGDPWTWTFHVRAFSEANARKLVAERLKGEAHVIYACEPSEPLSRAPPKEEIVADYGPYRRSWRDPMMAQVRPPS
ncbi:MAG TPA: hypothetical protein VFY93_10045 [Planctomycetota bacterium]|nr:hypothetical protein [Planctomycetota bacterium]